MFNLRHNFYTKMHIFTSKWGLKIETGQGSIFENTYICYESHNYVRPRQRANSKKSYAKEKDFCIIEDLLSFFKSGLKLPF